MRDWRTEPLERIAEIRSSNVDKKSNPGEEPVRLCNYMDVYSREYITEDIEFMEATATSAEIQRFGIERGDVMITKDSETPDDIGIPTVVVDDIPKLVCGYHVALIKPKRAEVDPVYLAKQLGLSDTARYYGRLANGSTRYGLSFQSIARTPIRLAPLPQQQRIAEILSTVDEAIEQTEALIAKTQQIKAGLMHDLFTRGVTANGQLRPPREDAPQLYKESPLGWIPKEWEAGDLETYCEVHNRLRKPLSSEVRELMQGPYPYYGPTGILDFINEYMLDGEYCLIGEDGDHFLKFHRQPMTQLVTGKFNVNNHAHIISGRNGASTAWLHRFYESRDITLHLTRQGAGRFKLNKAALLKLPIVVPEPNEQGRILQRLDVAGVAIESELADAAKLRELKRGLMHDLLTGHIPVAVESVLEPKEVAASV